MGATDKPLQVYCLCKHMGSCAASRHPCRQRHLEPDYPHISLTIIKELSHFTFVIGLQLATSPEHLPPQTLHWSCQNHRAFGDSLHLPAFTFLNLPVWGHKWCIHTVHSNIWRNSEDNNKADHVPGPLHVMEMLRIVCRGAFWENCICYMRWSRTRTQHML